MTRRRKNVQTVIRAADESALFIILAQMREQDQAATLVKVEKARKHNFDQDGRMFLVFYAGSHDKAIGTVLVISTPHMAAWAIVEESDRHPFKLEAIPAATQLEIVY